MNRIALFALMAMVPAVINISPAGAHATITVPICSGDGALRTVSLPLGPRDVPGKDVPGCCVKGCHGGERKRGVKRCC